MNEMNYGWQMGYGWFYVIITSIVIISLIAIIINQKRVHNRLISKSPIEIIKERFAKGEIRDLENAAKEKFEEMKENTNIKAETL